MLVPAVFGLGVLGFDSPDLAVPDPGASGLGVLGFDALAHFALAHLALDHFALARGFLFRMTLTLSSNQEYGASRAQDTCRICRLSKNI